MSLVFRSRRAVMRLAAARVPGAAAPGTPPPVTAARRRLEELRATGMLPETEAAEAETIRRIPPD